MPTDNLGREAYRVVDELALHIGPRPAGSDGERRALDYVAIELGKYCREVQHLPVPNLPAHVSMQWLLILGGASLVACTDTLVQAPQNMLLFLILFFALPKALSWVRRQASAKSELASENVDGYQPTAGERKATVVLCAHLDSAKASRVPGVWLPKVNRLLTRALVPFTFGTSLLAALRWLDLRYAWFTFMPWAAIRLVAWAFSLFFLVFESFYLLISRGNAYSPGANDNASGVGVVLALAKHFHDAPPAHLDLRYLLFTAEELGLIGSQRFARETKLDKASTYVINLDMVGSGNQLCYIQGAELLPPRFTDQGLNALLRQAHPAIKGHYYWMGNSDFHSFLARGYRAASLDVQGDSRADTVYHTERDVLEYVRPAALQMTAETVSKVIDLLEKQVGG